jgi:hypothetical protein
MRQQTVAAIQFNVMAGPVIINAEELCGIGMHSHCPWSVRRKNGVCHKLALCVNRKNGNINKLASLRLDQHD